jgi:hypothetical protein
LPVGGEDVVIVGIAADRLWKGLGYQILFAAMIRWSVRQT